MYFTLVTDLSRQLPLYVTGIGVQTAQEPIQRPAGFPGFQLTYCARGAGAFRVEGKTHELRVGDCFLFAPGIPHEYHAVEEPWETRWVTFHGAQAETLLPLLGFGRFEVFRAGSPSGIPQRIRDIEQDVAQDAPGVILETSPKLYALLVEASRALHGQNASSAPSRAAQLGPVLAFIDAHHAEAVTLEALAACIHVTPYHLCRLFRRAFSLTPFQYLMRVRVQKAKQLLIQQPDLKIGAVARTVGYRDASSFCALFRSLENSTPQTFRRNHGV